MIETEIQKLTAAVTQLTVTAEALLETLRHRAPSAPVEVAAIEPAPKPKKVKAPKVEEPAPVVAPAPEPAPEPAKVVPPAVEGFTVQDLRAEAQKALETGKSAEIVALNKEYGVKRISEVTPDLYPAIIKKLRAINGQT